MNLLDLFNNQLSDGLVGKVASLVGGNSNAVKTGLQTAGPSLLGGLMSAAQTKEGANSIFNSLGDGSVLNNIGGLLGGGSGTDNFLNSGTSFVKGFLGDKIGGITDLLGSTAGLGKGAAGKILSIAGSLFGGVLGKQKAAGMGIGDFMGLLSNQGSILEKFAPKGLASVLGLASLTGLGGKLGDLAGNVFGFAGNAGGKVLEVAGDAVGAVGNAGKAVVGGAANLAGGALGAAGDLGKGVAGAAGNLGKGALGAAGNLGKGAANLAGDAAGTVGNAGKAVIGGAGKVVGGAADLAGGAAKAGVSAFWKIARIVLPILLLIGGYFIISTLLKGGSLKDAGTKGLSAITNPIDAVKETAGDVVDGATAVGGAVVDGAGAVVEGASNLVSATGEALGSLFSWALPGGESLNIPKGGFENQFLDYVKAGDLAPGKFYNFDRLFYNTGSAALSTESDDQISNVFKIMTAYPELNILLRGHTDNTGGAAGNKALSLERANSVKTALVALGVAESRIATSGEGSEFPIGDNATDQGRKQNRRIDISIAK